MIIKMKISLATPGHQYKKGTCHEVNERIGQIWINTGLAEAAPKRENTKPKPEAPVKPE